MRLAATLIFFFTFISVVVAYGQDSKEDKRLLDSLIENDEFLQYLNALDDDKSTLTVSLAVGNRLASVSNNSLNAQQGNTKTLVVPGITYAHKSGLGISAQGYVLNYKGKTRLHRFGLTPFFQYAKSDAFAVGVSYTRFFSDETYNAVESPIQNDIYVNGLYKRSYIQPGLSIGYSTGAYKEIDDVTINIPREGRTVVKDTVITSVRSFSVTGSVEHQYILHHDISKQQALIFTPSLLLNAGSNTFDIEHKNNFADLIRGRGRRRLFRNQSASTSFDLQSVGANLYLNYSIKKFSVQPQLYFDYYLPSTTDTRLSKMYNVSVEYSF